MSAIELIEKLPVDVIKSMSPDDWIKSAWDAAVEGIVCGSATILGTENGIWRVRCESIETLRSLQGRVEIISRLHRIHDLRKLPPLRGISLIPPDDFCSPFALIKRNVIMQMPEHQWIKYAYQLSVDAETARTSSVIDIDHGIYHIRCDSSHAYQALKFPQTLIGMISWLSRKYRPLPEIRQVSLSLGQIKDEKKE